MAPRPHLRLGRAQPDDKRRRPDRHPHQSYDDLGRLSVVSRGDQRFTYGYDANGTYTSRTWPDGTTINGDLRGRRPAADADRTGRPGRPGRG